MWDEALYFWFDAVETGQSFVGWEKTPTNCQAKGVDMFTSGFPMWFSSKPNKAGPQGTVPEPLMFRPSQHELNLFSGINERLKKSSAVSEFPFRFSLNWKVRLDTSLFELLVSLCSVSIGSVYFSLACGQTTDQLTTTVLDQLKRLMRPVLIMSPPIAEGGTETGRLPRDYTLLVGRRSHDWFDESIFPSTHKLVI